jgi:hypothetical protein
MLALCAGATEASKVGKIRLIIKLLLERSGVFANVHPVTIVEEAICYNGLAKGEKGTPNGHGAIYVGSLHRGDAVAENVRADKGSAPVISGVLPCRYDSNSDVPLFFITSSNSSTGMPTNMAKSHRSELVNPNFLDEKSDA